jgi:hypothetical protein
VPLRQTQPLLLSEAVSMNRRRFAVVLVPVPEGSDVDGEVEVLPFQGSTLERAIFLW